MDKHSSIGLGSNKSSVSSSSGVPEDEELGGVKSPNIKFGFDI